MTHTSITKLATLTAMTIVLAAPGIVLAKTTASQGTKHTLGKPLTTQAKSVTTSGKVVSEVNGVSKNGDGSWTKTVTYEGHGVRELVTTTTYPNGVTITRNDNITVNKTTGVVVDDAQITTTNGSSSQTVSKDFTYTPATGGVVDIAEVITNAKGHVTDLNGTDTKTTITGGVQNVVDLTNSKTEKSQDLTYDRYSAGDATATTVTGTGFNGQAINGATLRTTNNVASGNYVDNSTNGQGTYTYSSTKTTLPYTNNVTIVQTNIAENQTFANGATNDVSKTITPNSVNNGITLVSSNDNYTNAQGAQSSSSTNVSYDNNGNGTSSIAGNFSQSNGYSGYINGSTSKTNYGSSTSVQYNATNGATKSASVQTLALGDASFSVTNGTSFAGKPSSSAQLVTGQQN